MRHIAAEAAGTEWGDLLSAVAEQLKVPLTIIARQAELWAVSPESTPSSLSTYGQATRIQADAALQLVDCYLLGLELLRGQTQLNLEPVSVSSTLVDAAHALSRYARQYEVRIEVEVAGKYEPVMAHGRGLKAALVALGFSLIEAQAAHEDRRAHQRLVLGTHRTAHGISTGIYGMDSGLHPSDWRAARQLAGRAPQPFVGLSPGSGAGLFVADTIFRSMASELRVGLWQRRRGLAATLQPSRQLQLV